jgi:hypothetical protein
MLVHAEPAAIALASEDNRLALMQCLGPGTGDHVSDDVVNEYRRVAEHLNTNTGGQAFGDPEVVLAYPSVPQPPIGVKGLQPFGSGLEDEGRVMGETCEIVIESSGTEAATSRSAATRTSALSSPMTASFSLRAG